MALLSPLRVLLVSTSVGPLGSGLGGGVELTLKNFAQALRLKGHRPTVLAPKDSVLEGFELYEVPGQWQIPQQTLDPQAPMCLPDNSVLVNLWEQARAMQTQYDLIVNFAYDWLPFYLTPFFQRPVAHLVSMGSLTAMLDRFLHHVNANFPQALAFHSQSQAGTFGLKSARCIGNALDLALYQFCPQPQDYLAWVGRISPEKGLEDALAACQTTGQVLRIYGKVQDESYWQALQGQFPQASAYYRGFLSTEALQAELRQSRALVMTPRWVEAFGNVVIEAMACGVPVVAYRRGGPSEIVREGQTGFLVEPDNVMALAEALKSIDHIDRQACRWQTEQDYSLPAFAERLDTWFQAMLADA
ncbi:glycosyltransferase family 4 protein [Synechocystis sp. LKSZ1]|uniref:glycosyltransferase family 4 protein n=1 Tax=Synechocystis sp. LKSZ1 TaxID=3144951 RepID=UPI00336C2982